MDGHPLDRSKVESHCPRSIAWGAPGPSVRVEWLQSVEDGCHRKRRNPSRHNTYIAHHHALILPPARIRRSPVIQHARLVPARHIVRIRIHARGSLDAWASVYACVGESASAAARWGKCTACGDASSESFCACVGAQ